MKDHSSFLRLAICAVLVAGASACTKPTGRNPFAAPGTGRGEGSIQIRVENQNFGDATIYAIRGGERIRLGKATGKAEQNFTLSWNFSLPLEFEINIIGDQGCGVRALSVDPGDRVWVRIPSHIGSSSCDAGKT